VGTLGSSSGGGKVTGIFWLDWAAMALSLANTILLIWLGTTVLFNVEQRSWGGWLAAIGLYFGGIFFISHTAILGYGLQVISIGTTFWWAVGLLAVTVLPLLWYVMMLWYSGYWEKPKSGEPNRLAKRHRLWILLVMVVLLISVLAVRVIFQQQPISGGYPARGINETPNVSGVPVVLLMFPLYLVLCLGLSLDAVRNPGPTRHEMGELARKRARPWLISASLMLLLVSLAVMVVFGWLLEMVGAMTFTTDQVYVIGVFDVVIEAFIAGAVILVGQAVVAYEIFTGQSLPRKGFIRQWHYAVLIALGFGIVIGFVFSTNLRPIYGVLISSILMTFFLALFSWRMISERQRTIRSLRPFVTSERIYDQVVGLETELDEYDGVLQPFKALCQDVLGTRRACLLAVGSMSPLAGAPLLYSGRRITSLDQAEAALLNSAVQEIIGGFVVDEQIIRVSLEMDHGFDWGVPLWRQRGLVGVLLLGSKQDEGLYSREEIDVAQSSGERLVDSRVSAEVTRRLLGLQRQRLAETQVLDQRVRRVLHDEVLQDLHAAILKLAGVTDNSAEEAIEMMTGVHGEISRLIRNLPGTSLPDLAGQGLIESLKRLVEDEIGPAFDGVEWEMTPEAERVDDDLSQLEQEVLYYAAREVMRNAARHGRVEGADSQPLGLRIAVFGDDGIRIVIEDDGVGFEGNEEGMQTSKQGLPLHSTMLAVIGGEMKIESELGEFSRVSLILKK